MKLWIDNTGLHSAGRCIDVQGNGEPDVAGLCQLATQLVFADSLHISTFESPGIRQRSESVMNHLTACGLPGGVLALAPTTKEAFRDACTVAAKRLAEDLEFSTVEGEVSTGERSAGAIPDLNPKERATLETTHGLFVGETSDAQRSELAEAALSPTGSGGHDYMLLGCDPLWLAVKKLARRPTWSLSDTIGIVVHARYYLNEELSRVHKSEYAPAVGRSRTIRKRNRLITTQLDGMVLSAAKRLEPELVGLPSIADAIATRSKGDPRGFIEESIRARDRATALRASLEKHMDSVSDTGLYDFHGLRTELAELNTVLEQDLGLTNAPSLKDAWEIQFIGFIPIPHPVRLYEWVEFQHKRKRIAILSEFAKTLAYERIDEFAYERLLKRCSKPT